MSALKVIVRQDRENFVHFIIRLCSVIAGIIVISGVRSANTIIYLHLHNFCSIHISETFNTTKFLFCAGFLSSVTQKIASLIENVFLKNYAPEVYRKLIESRSAVDTSKVAIPDPPKPASTLPPNVLLQNAEQMANVKFNFAAL